MKWSLASVYCLSHILSQLKSFTLEGKAVGHEAGQSSSLYFTAVLWSTHRLVRYKCSHSLRMTSYCRILLKARLLNKTSHPIYPSPPSYFLLCFLPLIPSVSLQFFFLCSFTLLLICINHVSPISINHCSTLYVHVILAAAVHPSSHQLSRAFIHQSVGTETADVKATYCVFWNKCENHKCEWSR